MLTHSRPSVLVMAAGLALSCAQVATAQTTVNWAAGVNGNWGTSSNWSPSIVPDNSGVLTYNVNLPNYGVLYTVTLDTTRDVTNLNVNGTSQDTVLDLAGNDLSLAGNFNLNKGYIAGDGGGNRIIVGGTATFNGGMYMWADLETNGNLVFSSSSDEEFCDTGVDHNGSTVTWSGTGDIQFLGGSVFNHNVGSTFNITHAGNNLFNGSGIDTFNNFGTMVKSGGTGTTTFQNIDFQNKGTLKILSGEVKFVTTSLVSEGELTEGAFEIAESAGMRVMNAAGQDEEIQTCSARVSLSGVNSRFVSLDALQTITDKGQLQLESGRNFRSRGAINNQGAIRAVSQARFELSAGSVPSVNTGLMDASDQGVIAVLGGAAIQNDGAMRASGQGAIAFLTGSTLNNIVGGTLVDGRFFAESGGLIIGDQFAGVRRLEAVVVVNGQDSDIRGSQSGSMLNGIRIIGSAGSLEFNDRTVTLSEDLFIDQSNGQSGTLVVGDHAVLSFTNGARFASLTSGEFSLGSLTVRGEVIADNLAIRRINSKVTLDRPTAILRNRTTGLDALSSLEQIGSRAELTIAQGRDLITTGNLNAEAGSVVRIGAPSGQNRSRLDIAGSFTLNGTCILEGGELSALQTVNAGQLRGNGFIGGEVINLGLIAPGIGIGGMNYAGDLRTFGQSAMEFELAGSLRGVSYDTINVAEELEFIGAGGSAGLLRLILVDHFTPADGERFLLISHGSRIGAGFSEFDFLGLPSGASFAISYEDAGVFATYSVPAPGSVSILALMGIFGSRRRR
ncbi:MAG: hypothetical protein ACK54H_02125 [Phycisphaerales bacterium]